MTSLIAELGGDHPMVTVIHPDPPSDSLISRLHSLSEMEGSDFEVSLTSVEWDDPTILMMVSDWIGTCTMQVRSLKHDEDHYLGLSDEDLLAEVHQGLFVEEP